MPEFGLIVDDDSIDVWPRRIDLLHPNRWWTNLMMTSSSFSSSSHLSGEHQSQTTMLKWFFLLFFLFTDWLLMEAVIASLAGINWTFLLFWIIAAVPINCLMLELRGSGCRLIYVIWFRKRFLGRTFHFDRTRSSFWASFFWFRDNILERSLFSPPLKAAIKHSQSISTKLNRFSFISWWKAVSRCCSPHNQRARKRASYTNILSLYSLLHIKPSYTRREAWPRRISTEPTRLFLNVEHKLGAEH